VHYRLEEIEIADRGSGQGRTLGDIRGDSMIVGLRRGAVFEPQPPSDTVLTAGDTIVAIGTPQTLARLETLLEAPSA
jgi:voltage-gated potassium channel